jgi:hypothetical protein
MLETLKQVCVTNLVHTRYRLYHVTYNNRQGTGQECSLAQQYFDIDWSNDYVDSYHFVNIKFVINPLSDLLISNAVYQKFISWKSLSVNALWNKVGQYASLSKSFAANSVKNTIQYFFTKQQHIVFYYFSISTTLLLLHGECVLSASVQ